MQLINLPLWSDSRSADGSHAWYRRRLRALVDPEVFNTSRRHAYRAQIVRIVLAVSASALAASHLLSQRTRETTQQTRRRALVVSLAAMPWDSIAAALTDSSLRCSLAVVSEVALGSTAISLRGFGTRNAAILTRRDIADAFRTTRCETSSTHRRRTASEYHGDTIFVFLALDDRRSHNDKGAATVSVELAPNGPLTAVIFTSRLRVFDGQWQVIWRKGYR